MDLKLKNILLLVIILCTISCGGGEDSTEDSSSLPEIPSNSPPTVENVLISGEKSVGSELVVSYQYKDSDNDNEGNTEITWYKDGKKITLPSSEKYTVLPDDKDSSISVSVTPIALSGTLRGKEIFSERVIVRALKEFTLRTSCPYYISSITNEIWPHEWTSQAVNIIVELVDDNGNVLEELISRRGDGFTGYGIHINGLWALDYNRDDYEILNELLSESEDNLLFTCTYINHKNGDTQHIKQFVPLLNADIWEPRIEVMNGDFKLNESFFEISFLSDLHYQVYLFHITNGMSKQESLNIANEYMDDNFRDTVYGPQKIQSFDTPAKIRTIRASDSIQATNYKRLQISANERTNEKIEVLNELIGLNYFEFLSGSNVCPDDIVCALYIDNALENLSKDPLFENEVADWDLDENLNPSATGSISTTITQVSPRRNNLIVDITKSDHGADTSPSQLEVFQVIRDINIQKLNKMIFMVDSISLDAGCRAFGGFCLSSGFAGYYACFFSDTSDEQLGCILIGNWSDPITLPILIGEYFKIESSSRIYYQESVTTRYRQAWNLEEVIDNRLPYVRENLEYIDKIIVGTVVGEFISPGGYCQECFGKVEVKQLGLYKIKE